MPTVLRPPTPSLWAREQPRCAVPSPYGLGGIHKAIYCGARVILEPLSYPRCCFGLGHKVGDCDWRSIAVNCLDAIGQIFQWHDAIGCAPLGHLANMPPKKPGGHASAIPLWPASECLHVDATGRISSPRRCLLALYTGFWEMSDIAEIGRCVEARISERRTKSGSRPDVGRRRMTRTKAAVVILVGIGLGVLGIFLSGGVLVCILRAVSICLVLYGVYLYASESRKNSN